MSKWKGMLAVGVAASAATALSVAVSSPADSGRGWRDHGRGDRAQERDLHAGRRHGHRAPGAHPAGDRRQGRRAGDGQAALRRLVHTDSADPEEAVTDSAAGRHGVRHRRPHLQRRRRRRRRRQAGEDAARARAGPGKATGLVTTAQVTDATPGRVRRARPGPGRRRARSPGSSSRRASPTSSSAAARTGGPRGRPGRATRTTRQTRRGEQEHQRQLVERAEGLGYDYVSNADELARHAAQGARAVRQRGDVRAVPGGPGRRVRARGAAHDDDREGARRRSRATGRGSSCWSRRRPSTRSRTTTTPSDDPGRAGARRDRGDGARVRREAPAAPWWSWSVTTRRVGWRSRTSTRTTSPASGTTRVRRGRAVPDREQRPRVHRRLDDRRAHRCGHAGDRRGPGRRAVRPRRRTTRTCTTVILAAMRLR